MTTFIPDEPAQGGRVWAASKSPSDSTPILIKILLIGLSIGLFAVWTGGSGFFIWISMNGRNDLPNFIDFLGIGVWTTSSFAFIWAVRSFISEQTIRRSFAKKLFTITSYVTAGTSILIFVGCLIVNPFNQPDRIERPLDSWVAAEATQLTGEPGFKVTDTKIFDDKTHLTAVVESEKDITLIDLHYKDGEWKATLK